MPYFARHHRVLTFDGRGNGLSDRPAESSAYDEREFAADALAILDATGTEQATIVSLSLGAQRALLLAAEHPDRVDGLVFLAPTLPLSDPVNVAGTFEDVHDELRGLGQVQREPLAQRLARFPEVVLRDGVLHRAALHEAGRGLHAVGARHDRRDDRHCPVR